MMPFVAAAVFYYIFNLVVAVAMEWIEKSWIITGRTGGLWIMNLLELNHVEKSFENLSVLKDISISIGEGEIVSIIGPSGSGKSTLLRCATMLEKMDGGEIVYLGKKAAWTDKDGHVSMRIRRT